MFVKYICARRRSQSICSILLCSYTHFMFWVYRYFTGTMHIVGRTYRHCQTVFYQRVTFLMHPKHFFSNQWYNVIVHFPLTSGSNAYRWHVLTSGNQMFILFWFMLPWYHIICISMMDHYSAFNMDTIAWKEAMARSTHQRAPWERRKHNCLSCQRWWLATWTCIKAPQSNGKLDSRRVEMEWDSEK